MLGDLGKLIVAKGFKKLPKVQKIARSGHTGTNVNWASGTEREGVRKDSKKRRYERLNDR